MSAEALFLDYLKKDDVIGSLVQGRLFDTYMPEWTPDKLYPCLVYSVTGREHVQDLQGNAGLYYPRYSLDLWSLRSADLRTFVDRIYALEGRLDVRDGTTKLLWLWVDDETDSAEPTQQNDERAARSASVDVILWYSQG